MNVERGSIRVIETYGEIEIHAMGGKHWERMRVLPEELPDLQLCLDDMRREIDRRNKK